MCSSTCFCYYQTDQAQWLCDSKECGRKYKYIEPAKRGAMNSISCLLSVIVSKMMQPTSVCLFERMILLVMLYRMASRKVRKEMEEWDITRTN